MSKSKSILVIEDENTLNEAYQLVLAKAGYDVLSAFDGKEALQILKEVTPDIILLDLRMPVMDGIEFLKNYNKDKSIKNPPRVIVFSNYDMQKEIDQAYALGADRYVLKSMTSPRELISLVSENN